MKTKNSLIVLLAFGFSLTGNAETLIPAPIFYKLSKHLLNETQHFVENGEAKPLKSKPLKTKGVLCPLKCQPKKEQGIKNFGVSGLGNRESLWKIDSDT